MQTVDKIKLAIPTWALPAIINNDYSGLNPEESSMVKDWMFNNVQSNNIELDSISQFCEVEVDIENGTVIEFFSNFPEFGRPCTCASCTLIIFATIF